MALRLNVQDAMSAIRSWVPPNSKNSYRAVLNNDGSIRVTQNNTTVLNNKFWYNVTAGSFSSAKTDASGGNYDTVMIEDSDGSNPRVSDFQQWLNALP